MRLISWNLCFLNKVEPKIELLKSLLKEDTIIVLQEVLPHFHKEITSAFEDDYHILYSLEKRAPSVFDTRAREMGVAVLIAKSFEIEYFNVLERALFPDRTVYVRFKKANCSLSLFGLHSVAGATFKKAKSVQFFSFAEAVANHKPDLVFIDANEPEIDHPERDKIVYWDNSDKGKGVWTFFDEIDKSDGIDPLRLFNTSTDIPLAVSYKTNTKKGISNNPLFNKRYDFIMVNSAKFETHSIEYLYDQAVEAGSDHAVVVCDVSLR